MRLKTLSRGSVAMREKKEKKEKVKFQVRETRNVTFFFFVC